MKEGFTLIWSFRNRINILKRSIETADRLTPKEVKFLLVDANSDYENIKELRNFVNSIEGREIRIVESFYRSSLSEAWNQGFMLSDTRYVIFASSDVEFVSNSWFKLIEECMKTGIQYFLLQNHAVFCAEKIIIPRVGWFDEGYKIGAHFDTDYLLRMSEANIKVGIIPNLNEQFYRHGHDDVEIEKERNTIKDDDIRVKDRLPFGSKENENYFKSKWKSDWVGWENFDHPPTHISQVKRNFPEIDPHPLWSKKFI